MYTVITKTQRINSVRNKLLEIAVTAFYIVIFTRDILGANIPFIFISVMSLLFALFMNSNERFCYICALLPFCRGIPYSEIILYSFFLDLILRIKKVKWNNRLYMPILLIILIDIIDMFVFDSLSNEIIYLSEYMIYVAYIVVEKLYADYERKIVYLFSLSTIFASLFVIVREINSLGWNYIMLYGVRFGTGFNTGEQFTNFNSNEFGLYCSLAVIMMLLCYFKEKRIIPFILSIILTALGFFSVSRAYMLIVIIIWLLYFLVYEKRAKSIAVVIASLSIALLIIYRYFNRVFEWVFSYYSSRDIFGVSDGGGGRIAIMIDYFNHYFSSVWGMIFGYSEEYMNSLKMSYACHNASQEILISWGIVGFVISVFWIANVFNSINNKRKISSLELFPLIVFFVYIQSLQFFTMHNYLIIMLISFISINLIKMENDNAG